MEQELAMVPRIVEDITALNEGITAPLSSVRPSGRSIGRRPGQINIYSDLCTTND